jgi:hypothetical protein
MKKASFLSNPQDSNMDATSFAMIDLHDETLRENLLQEFETEKFRMNIYVSGFYRVLLESESDFRGTFVTPEIREDMERIEKVVKFSQETVNRTWHILKYYNPETCPRWLAIIRDSQGRRLMSVCVWRPLWIPNGSWVQYHMYIGRSPVTELEYIMKRQQTPKGLATDLHLRALDYTDADAIMCSPLDRMKEILETRCVGSYEVRRWSKRMRDAWARGMTCSHKSVIYWF